jgi:hypothetical protein
LCKVILATLQCPITTHLKRKTYCGQTAEARGPEKCKYGQKQRVLFSVTDSSAYRSMTTTIQENAKWIILYTKCNSVLWHLDTACSATNSGCTIAHHQCFPTEWSLSTLDKTDR